MGWNPDHFHFMEDTALFLLATFPQKLCLLVKNSVVWPWTWAEQSKIFTVYVRWILDCNYIWSAFGHIVIPSEFVFVVEEFVFVVEEFIVVVAKYIFVVVQVFFARYRELSAFVWSFFISGAEKKRQSTL